MRSKILLLIVFILIFNFQFSIFNVHAQTSCDLCGKCEGSEEPFDYADCKACLYDASGTLKDGVSWTVLGCIPTSPGGFSQTIVNIIASIAGGISFVVFLYGGFKVLTSAGDPQRLSSGKSTMASAIIAGILIIFSVFIFKFVAIDILKLPGFGG